ncbi:MAG: hypothetical protein L0312_05650 [Acidobacteria bacterium]|nr:hypothetical protein [Acidobacteriota bacterium]
MPSIGSFLFGKDPKAQISTLGLQTPEQEALLKQLISRLGQGEGVTPFTGEQVAPLGELEGLSLEALEQKILQRVQGTGAEAEAQTALGRVLRTGGAPVDFEDYFQRSVRDPAVQEFRELILPELTRRYGSSGAFGSDRKLAEDRATEGLTRSLAGARSELAFRTQSDAANRLVQALQLAPGVERSSVESLLNLMQGAALPRSIEQARLTAEYTEFQRQQAQKQERINQILAALGLKTKENIPQQLPATPGFIGPFLTSFASGAGAANIRSGGGFFGL